MAHEPIKTKAGTQLPLIDLKGKPYLQVAHRLVWMREEHQDWSIETEINGDETVTTAKAIIKDATGRIIATAHKREHKVHFQDHAEKAETGAIGRALALCGYGTQFAPDMDEGDRIVDSPTARPTVKKTEPEYATEKQVIMLAKLKEQLGLPPLDLEKMGTMTKYDASKFIDQMKKKVEEKNAAKEQDTETPPPPSVPDEIDLDDIDFN